MQDFSEIINREDVYNIIVPVGIVVLGWIFTFLSNRFNNEKQWKQAVEKSKRDIYFNYFCLTIAAGGFLLFIFCFLIYLIEVLTKTTLGEMTVKVIYVLVCVLIYGFFICCRQDKRFAESKYLNIALLKIPFIISAMMWAFVFNKNVDFIWRLSCVVLAVYETFFLAVLDNRRTFKYIYAKFYLYSGKTIEKIKVEHIRQKKGWIIIQDELMNMEHRFRIKDVEKVEYRNED